MSEGYRWAPKYAENTSSREPKFAPDPAELAEWRRGDQVKRLEIYLKSGAVVDVEAEEVTTRRSPLTDELIGLDWTTPDGAERKLHTLALTEVAAVVIVR